MTKVSASHGFWHSPLTCFQMFCTMGWKDWLAELSGSLSVTSDLLGKVGFYASAKDLQSKLKYIYFDSLLFVIIAIACK